MTGTDTGSSESPSSRPISVAELLARNGTIGAPAVTRRRRRRRGDADSVTVAELTGEIPVYRDEDHQRHKDHQDHAESAEPTPEAPAADAESQVAEPAEPEVAPEPTPAPEAKDAGEAQGQAGYQAAYWSAPEPRWPKSAPQVRRPSGPERSEYPRPLRQTERETDQSGAEHMSPDPMDDYAHEPVDVMDTEVREAEPPAEDSAYVRSYLQASEDTLFGGDTLADEVARRRSEPAPPALHEAQPDADRAAKAKQPRRSTGVLSAVWRGILVVLQSILAVAFGAGLFIAFDQLWRWNPVVALVLSVLVILGLVVGVRVVRKTEDIASTLIAVAVGALITLGPLALSLQTG
ncbi:MAG: hypothetical protein JO236_19445 [Mycobacterium sp.]|uniref:hypothetical protein n=1 Tax=Mycobacterium sp. TaxID=1785 RepID=UPI001EC05DFB|nr:hypothetical protein [Mycobacterium sp.]MBW0019705.1 hypothetical protein [Mycobacterium sp.]